MNLGAGRLGGEAGRLFMLPPEWKEEIEQCVEGAQKRVEANLDRQSISIAASISSFRNLLKAYIRKQDIYERAKSRRESWTIWGLLVTIFLTLVVAAATALQTGAFILSERAFITAQDTDFTNGLVAGEHPLLMWIKLLNGGKSTANIQELVVAINDDDKLPAEPEYSKAQRIAFPSIFPQDAYLRELQFNTGPTGWPQSVIDELHNGVRKLHIYGVVRYEDDFSHLGPMETGFCFTYVPHPTPRQSLFQTCPELAYTFHR